MEQYSAEKSKSPGEELAALLKNYEFWLEENGFENMVLYIENELSGSIKRDIEIPSIQAVKDFAEKNNNRHKGLKLRLTAPEGENDEGSGDVNFLQAFKVIMKNISDKATEINMHRQESLSVSTIKLVSDLKELTEKAQGSLPDEEEAIEIIDTIIKRQLEEIATILHRLGNERELPLVMPTD